MTEADAPIAGPSPGETTVPAGSAPATGEPGLGGERTPRRHRRRRIVLAVLGVLAVAIVVLNWTYGRLPGEPKPTGSFAQVGKLRIHYIEHPGTGTPVVLIHGLPGTAEDWNAVTPLLSGHRTIAIDRPGFGYSSGDYVAFEEQLSTIHQLLAQLHVTRPILVGHSYGGTVSLGYAERYPGTVRGLVLVDAAAAGKKPDTLQGLQAHTIQVLQVPVIRQLANATFAQLLLTASAEMGDSEAFAPEPVASAHEHRVLAINMTHGNLEALAGEYLAAGGVVEQIDRGLHSIAVPAVVIQGEQDHLVGQIYGRRLASELPNARLNLLYGGHMQPYVHPAAIASAVQSLSGASARAKSH
ncbi:MAG: alpha/beta fold hydrolase [Solirubrobacteraceae bacterium]